MNCPHCSKVILVKLLKDDGKVNPETRPESATAGDIGALLASIDDVMLTGGEVNFVAETRARFKQYGANTRMSEKQMNWLQKIAAANGVD